MSFRMERKHLKRLSLDIQRPISPKCFSGSLTTLPNRSSCIIQQGNPMHQKFDLQKPIDASVLKAVIARLVKPHTLGQQILALEIIDGPYKGITFWFSKFEVSTMLARSDDGLTPIKFETKIFEAPQGFKPDEGFDEFCGEVLFAWLHYINNTEMEALMNADIGSDKIN